MSDAQMQLPLAGWRERHMREHAITKHAKVGRNSFLVQHPDGSEAYRYHTTDIVKRTGDSVTLDSGGWLTSTTKKHMNLGLRHFGISASVAQVGGKWQVHANGAVLPFTNGMRLPMASAKIAAPKKARTMAAHGYYVSDTPFNRENSAELVGKVFRNPPSYTAVTRVTLTPDTVRPIYRDVAHFRAEQASGNKTQRVKASKGRKSYLRSKARK